MKVKTDYVPPECNYLTAGKEYEVISGGEIIDDNGQRQYIHIPDSSHLNYRPWTIIEDPAYTPDELLGEG